MIDYFVKKSCFNDCHDVSFTLPRRQGRGYCRSVCPRKGMLLFMENYQLHREVCVKARNPLLQLGLSYCLSGRVDWGIEGRHEQFFTRKGQCELLFAGQTNGICKYGADEPVVVINIMLCPKLLQTYFDAPISRRGNENFLSQTKTGRDIFYKKQKIPGFVQQVLRQLLHLSCERMADKLLIQGKVLELVAFQLDQLDPPDLPARTKRKPPADLDMIERAKSILQSHMQSPPSLRSLAHLLGTNETKLKKSFITGCGTTVYGYLTACRMYRACELLQDEELTMSQIGAELGYSERTHFSRAFSRYYGVSPSRYRRRLQHQPPG